MANKKSDIVTKNKLLCRFWWILSFLCAWLPLIGFSIYAFANSEVNSVQKVTLSITLLASIIIAVFNLIQKKHLRSPFYLVLIGLYVGLRELLPVLLTLTTTSILDEFVFNPLYNLYKTKYIASKEAVGVYNELQG